MIDDGISASGVISVASNVAPAAVQEMTKLVLEDKVMESDRISLALKPLFNIVTVKTVEDTPFGSAIVKSRNPVPYKTLMNILGMSSGPPRPPLGKMTKKGIDIVIIESGRSPAGCRPMTAVIHNSQTGIDSG